tara:strand:+ start:1086 stop:1274 length:189 start_codon:yes stop_codon:yes gene_type:complete
MPQPLVQMPLKDRIRSLKFRRAVTNAKIKTLSRELDTATLDQANQAIELDELQEELEKELVK